MKKLLAALVLVAACGSKSPKPATPEENETGETATEEMGNNGEGYVPDECDTYCAEGCAGVEDTEGCTSDCGCPPDWQDHLDEYPDPQVPDEDEGD